MLYKYALESETSNKEWSTPSAIAFSDLPTISEDNVRFTESIIDRLNSDLNNEVFIPILSEVVTALVSKDSTLWNNVLHFYKPEICVYAHIPGKAVS